MRQNRFTFSKRPMILFEVMIGLALLSGLLYVLFSFFTSSARLEQKIQKAESALLERQHASQRLQSILTSVIPNGGKESEASLYVERFPEEKLASLVVYFDHGIDPDPAFSGPSLARIYLNEEKQLCLAIWPREREKGKTSVRQEVLLENIRAFSFRFLTKNMDQSVVWETKRPKEPQPPIPSLIQLDLWEGEAKDPSLQFAFLLPSSEPSIVYPAHQGGKKNK